MTEKFPFFNELILPSENECKGTTDNQQINNGSVFCLLSSEPQAEWTAENRAMLSKIIQLCGFSIDEIQITDMNGALDVNDVINHPDIETILCFANQSIWNELHYTPGKRGFMELNGKQVIFLPELTAFAANPKAKKYLWQAIQNTLQK